jgi:hypothetical protein
MSEVKSPLGKKTFASGQRKVLTISDDTFEDVPMPRQEPQSVAPRQQIQPPLQSQQPVQLTAEQFKELQARRNELRTVSKRAAPEAKLRAEILCGIGRLQTEVEVGDHKFVLQSLKAGEMKEVLTVVSQVSAAATAMFEMRAHVLARALVMVDDQPIDLILGTSNIEDIIDFVNELQESLVNQLYTSYTTMVKENENKFTVKDGQDAREVAEEIKK